MRSCSCDVSTSILLLYSLVRNLPVSASTIHPNMTSHRMDKEAAGLRRLLQVLGDFAVEVEHLF